MSSKKLTLEETREQNIARNNEFLLQLFGTNLSSKQHSTKHGIINGDDDISTKKSNKVISNSDRFINECKTINSQISRHNEMFLFRSKEINELFGYVNNNLNDSPALLNTGPSGCGKTDLTLSVLRSLNVSFVHMSCKGFDNIKQFISSLWLATKKSLEDALRQYHSIHSIKSKIQDLLLLEMKPPTKFMEYASSLGKIVSFLFNDNDDDNVTDSKRLRMIRDKKESQNDISNVLNKQNQTMLRKEYFFVHLDSLDHISYVDQLSANKSGNSILCNLLNLMYYSHPRVKVIANMECIPVLTKPCIVIKYSFYDEKQINAILMRRFKNEIKQWKETNIQLMIDKSGSLENNIIESLEMIETDGIDFIRRINTAILDNILLSYHHLVNLSLAKLISSISCGYHPDLIYDAVNSVWIALYGYKQEKYSLEILYNILQLWPKRNNIVPSNVDSPTTADIKHNSESLLNPDYEQNLFIKQYSIIPQPTSNQIQDATLLVLNLPNYRCNFNQLVALSKKRKIEAASPIAIQLNSNIQTSYRSNSNTLEISRLNQTSDLMRTKKILSEIDQFDTNTMKLKDWYEQCPVRVKYLLLAAFLAGTNPKESDRMKFFGDKVERRKKQRIGSDANPDQLNPGQVRNTNQQRNNGFMQYFSLERLISIYVQIVNINTQKSPKGYGDVSIYCTIKNLVEKHIIKESLSWSIDRPFYTSCITQTAADEIAQSINFNLHDFMYEKSRTTIL